MTPARDPKTGQFVSGSGGGALDWNDVEQQLVQVEHQAGLNDTHGLGTNTDRVDSQEMDVTSDGLDRGEVAEVLGILWDTTTMPLGGSDVDNRMSTGYRMGWEFGTDPAEGVNARVTGSERQDYDHAGQTFEAGTVDEDEAGVLARGELVYFPPTRDATNGGISGPFLGGPSHGGIWYYPLFRNGPMVDRFDDLFWQAEFTVNHHNNPVGDIATNWNARVIYQVHEDVDVGIGRS